MSTMPAVFLPGSRRVEVRDVEMPSPGPGQVVVRTRASGICGSDLRAIYRPVDQGVGPEAYRGVVAGHEPCGVIESIGPGVTEHAAGDRVVVYHIAGCGLCPDCRAGWMISCSSPERAAYGWQRDGGHAPYLLAEERTLVRLPEPLTFLDGAVVACGLGTAYAACRRVGVSGRDRVLITGLGPVGIGAAMLCRAFGAEVLGVEAIPERRALASRLGFEVLDPADGLMARTGGTGFEVAIECSGNPDARVTAVRSARPWGRVAFVGEGKTVSLDVSPLIIHPQLTIVGSWVCSITQMQELVDLLVRWDLHPDAMVTDTFALDEARAAYELADGGRAGKVAILP